MNMQFWVINLFCAFILSVIFTGIIIPQILLIAFKRRLFDELGERKIHNGRIPRLGGIAFNPGVFFSIVLLFGANLSLGYDDILVEMGNNFRPLAFGSCTVLLIYLLGIVDDLIGVRYRTKFVVQIICGIMLISGDIWIHNLYGIFGIYEIPIWLGCPLTILIIVIIINAINLIDGIDGLASGLCSVAFIFYGLSFFLLEQYFYSMLAFSTLGVLLTFFYYNVFGDPNKQKKIFMGDTGSLTIGMMLCFLSISLADSKPIEFIGDPNPLVLAFAPLLIPCCDLARVYFYRVRNGKNPFLPDKNHIHHKLLAVGLQQKRVRIIIVSFSILLTLCNILISTHININWLCIGNIFLWTIVNIWLSNKINLKFKLNKVEYEN